MERVLDDLEQIHFSMKKANQVLRDMTRGIATDRRACSWRGTNVVGDRQGPQAHASQRLGRPMQSQPSLSNVASRANFHCFAAQRTMHAGSTACSSTWPVKGQGSQVSTAGHKQLRSCRCLQFFLMVIILAVVIIIILKVAGVGALKNAPLPLPSFKALTLQFLPVKS